MVPVRQTKPCRQRYHEGTGATTVPLCACSTFAIGLCADCGEPVCGDCSWLRDGRRLCRNHTIEFDTAAERKKSDKAKAIAAAHDEALHAWTQAALETLAPLHEFDRLLRVVRLASSRPTTTGRQAIKVRTDILEALLGSTFGAESELPSWDDVELSRWFASRCDAPTTRLTPFKRRPRRVGSKRLRAVDAWRFGHGSTLRTGREDEHFFDAGICSDGRRLYPDGGDFGFDLPLHYDRGLGTASPGPERLNAWALHQMADLLQLPLLPEPPIPRPVRPVA